LANSHIGHTLADGLFARVVEDVAFDEAGEKIAWHYIEFRCRMPIL
jgi:hypothetical protein